MQIGGGGHMLKMTTKGQHGLDMAAGWGIVLLFVEFCVTG